MKSVGYPPFIAQSALPIINPLPRYKPSTIRDNNAGHLGNEPDTCLEPGSKASPTAFKGPKVTFGAV